MILETTMARVFARDGVIALLGCLGWEVFLEEPTPWQRGYWMDAWWPGRWVRIGLGGAILCIARLP